MTKKVTESDNNSLNVSQHNAITKARQDLSAVQLDLYFMMLSLLKPNSSKQDNTYEISVKEIEHITGRNWNYKQLREATLSLIGKTFEIEEADGLLQVALLSSAKYIRGTGRIQLTVAEQLKPYLFDLRNNFTRFELYSVLNMNSKYAKWLYVNFSRLKDLRQWDIEVDQLRYKLSLKDNEGKKPEQYKQWGQFKDNVLEPAIKQINEASDLEVWYEPKNKIGKKITSIRFHIDVKKQMQTLIPFEPDLHADPKVTRLKARLHEIGIIDQNIIRTVISSPEIIDKAYKALYDMSHNKEVKNKGGYFRTVMNL